MIFTDSVFKKICVSAAAALCIQAATAQTDVDAIMMNKHYLCGGAVYMQSSFKNYWEGGFRRDNFNIGTVTTRSYNLMGSYGITSKLNFIFNVPFVETKASAGTMHSMKGLQDLSMSLKYMPFLTHVGSKGIISAYAIGGVSFPLSNYVADYLPLSIGVRSKTATLRLMGDYQLGHFFATASGSYTFRSNITIDRNAYYTTEMHYTNKVRMYDMAGYNVRAGFRSDTWIAEGVLENMTSLGGYDIRKNDMPFPSNKMIATLTGINLKYTVHAVPGLELTGSGMYTISGRNVGQSTMFTGGIFYILNFTSKNHVNQYSKTDKP